MSKFKVTVRKRYEIIKLLEEHLSYASGSSDDPENAFVFYTDPDYSDQLIANMVGVSPKSVQRTRADCFGRMRAKRGSVDNVSNGLNELRAKYDDLLAKHNALVLYVRSIDVGKPMEFRSDSFVAGLENGALPEVETF